MSTHSITVSGPSPALAMLRALAIKAGHYAHRVLTAVRVALTTGQQVLRTAATTALAFLGSHAGYQLVRHAVRRVITTAARIVRAGLGLLGRALRAVGRLVSRGIALVSPAAAMTLHEIVTAWIVEPVQTVVRVAGRWLGGLGEALWHLTGTPLVRAVTTKAAQIAGLAVGLHALTKGALAAKVVSLLPWTMSAVVWVTQPLTAVVLVGAAFVTAMAAAAAVLATRAEERPEPDPDGGTDADSSLRDAGTPTLHTGPAQRTTGTADMDRIAARLTVEVTPDGSVVVHGVPDDLPEDLALQVAHTAADAATERLRRILLQRPAPNRDDKRVLTKVAREAVRRSAA